MAEDEFPPMDWEKKQMAAILGVFGGKDLNEEGAELFNRGDYAGAAEKYREALEGNLFGVGEKHVSTALCFGNLGRALRFMGHLDEAEYNLKKAMVASSNPDFREDLAKVYETKGDIALAGDTRRGGNPGYMACGNYKVRYEYAPKWGCLLTS